MASENLRAFQQDLGYQFTDKKLLLRAVTHASLDSDHYEQLEFLGDRVLSLIMAEILFAHYPDETEGGLAKRHAALVSGETLADIARNSGLENIIRIPERDKNKGNAMHGNLLSDVLEALIGAVYLDGGLAPCQQVIKKLWGGRPQQMEILPADPKTELQEWAQARGLPVPVYEVTQRDGPDHAPQFELQVCVEGMPPATGKGSSKRSAEKRAAAAMLAVIESKAKG